VEEEKANPQATRTPFQRPVKREAKTPVPFSGESQDKTVEFLFSCKTYLEMNAQTYDTDKYKILFVGSYLIDTAHRWYRTNTTHGTFDNMTYREFTQLFSEEFDHPDAYQRNLKKLKALKHRKGPLSLFIIKFNALGDLTGLEPYAISDIFRDALQSKTLIQMVSQGEPRREPNMTLRDLHEYQRFCRKVDTQLYEAKGVPTSWGNPPATANDNTPMDLDSTDLSRKTVSTEEKERRKRERLCAYDGKLDCGGFPDTNNCTTLKARKSGFQGRRA
jgi:hypothetical protein